jgi:hypothetical protein
LFAATEAPTPEPQTSAGEQGLAQRLREIGVVDLRLRSVHAQIDDLVTLAPDQGENRVPEPESPMVEGDCDSHQRVRYPS